MGTSSEQRSVDPRIRGLSTRLRKAIPHPRCELDFGTPWQLLVATILSAQSTDRMVNRVTPRLFERWPTPQALAAADVGEVEEVVKSTGFFRNKARAIQGASRTIAAEHGGELPRDLDAVLALPGVARKTANVVLGTALGLATGIVVDTHVTRVSQRLRLTRERDPVKIEADLCRVFAKRAWIDTGHRLVLHGRYVCTARAPRCERCPLNELCPSREAPAEGGWTERAAFERALVEARGEATG
jgi:endonuclease-3